MGATFVQRLQELSWAIESVQNVLESERAVLTAEQRSLIRFQACSLLNLALENKRHPSPMQLKS